MVHVWTDCLRSLPHRAREVCFTRCLPFFFFFYFRSGLSSLLSIALRRTYVSFDIIRRVLVEIGGFHVVVAMGITDVDDKIIRRANETKSVLLSSLSCSNTTVLLSSGSGWQEIHGSMMNGLYVFTVPQPCIPRGSKAVRVFFHARHAGIECQSVFPLF